MVKTGDKVRFLNEVGGGRVTGFQSKNIVLVEDEDGFEVPVMTTNVVVVESDDYSSAKMVKPLPTETKEGDDDTASKKVISKEPVEERKGGDKLSAYIAFVPVNMKDFSNTKFECYVVNDSNYYMQYTCSLAENDSWQLWKEGEIEPNTKEFIAEISREELNSFQRMTVQAMAYKRERPFILKPTISVQFRIDTTQFYKLHAFLENDFFEQPAMLLTIIEHDKQSRPLVIDSKQAKELNAQRSHSI